MNSIAKYLFAFILTLSISLLNAQPDALKFDRISVSQGLSHVTVNCIYQDSFGLIWLGTSDGLNLYDGHDFVIYKSDDNDPYSIKNNSILTIHEDQNQNLWIGTSQGLYKYNRNSKRFIRIQNELANSSVAAIINKDSNSLWIGATPGLFSIEINDSIPSKKIEFPHQVLSLINDSNKLWVGTSSSGLFSFQDNQFMKIALDQECQIRSLSLDKENALWIGTDNLGLLKMEEVTTAKTTSFQQFLTNQEILSVEIDRSNAIWVGTAEKGVFKLFTDGQQTSNYQFNNQELTSVSGNIIRSIHEDRSGNIWIGTWGNGVNIYSPEKGHFIHYRRNNEETNTLSHNLIHSIFETKDSLVWIGTKDGLNILNPITHETNSLYSNSENNLSNDYIKCVFQDSQNRLWIGTEKGLNLAKNYSLNPVFEGIEVPNPISDQDITFVYEDSKNNIWIGTWGGVYKYDESSQKLSTQIADLQFLSIVESDDGNFWMGTYQSGLFRFNPSTGQVDQFKHKENNVSSLPNNRIWTLQKDYYGKIWVGTFGGGLSKLIRKDGQITFQSWKEQDGLSSNSIIGILEDHNKNIWISGNNGLSQFDPTKKIFTNYYEKDGLQGNHFNVAYFKASDGKLYFGGDQGLTAFHPDSISKTNAASPLITKFELFNKPVEINSSSALKNDILTTDKIELVHSQNIFSFGFSDLNYSSSNSNFAYRLKNFNDDWTIANSQRRYVTYTNIPAGNYLFEVKILDRSRNFGDKTSTKTIVILPPWWETWWFKIIAILSGIGIISIVFKMRIAQIKKQKEVLEKSVIERTLELEQSKKQVEDDKLIIEKSLIERESLLKEIHHRVKNNLQIIASLLYLQSGKFENEDFKRVLEEGQGRVRSMALIHQKLYENENLKSIPFGEYLLELVSEIRASFGMGNIQLNIEAENIFFDVDTAVPLGLIVNEMATNAFKYAYEKEGKGSLSIYITEQDGEYTLNVKDDGKGIPDEIDIRKTKSLGLRLVRMLSQQLEGEFEFESTNGTSFQLKFAA